MDRHKGAKRLELTRSDRSRLNKVEKVRIAGVRVQIKDARKMSKSLRGTVIAKVYKTLPNRVLCPELNGYVSLKWKKGGKETAQKAALSAISTIAAQHVVECLERGVLVKSVDPKSGTCNQKCFIRMHILICPIRNLGYAKVLVGEYYPSDTTEVPFTHYCLTAYSEHQVTIKK